MTEPQVIELRSIVSLMTRGGYRYALDCLYERLRLLPNDVYAHHLLLKCYRTTHGLEDRWEFFREYYDGFEMGQLPAGLNQFLAAEELVYRHRYDVAINEYENAIAQGLDEAVVHYQMGLLRNFRGETIESGSAFEDAIRIERNFLPAISAYAELLFQTNKFDALKENELLTVPEDADHAVFDGESDTKRSVQRYVDAAEALRLTVSEFQSGELHRATESACFLVTSFTRQWHLIRTLVFLLYRSGWIEFGRKRLTEILRSNSPELAYAHGLCSYYEGELEDAVKHLNVALQASVNQDLSRHAMALVLQELKRDDDAAVLFNEAMHESPFQSGPRRALVEMQFKRGEYQCVVDSSELTDEEIGFSQAYEIQGLQNIALIHAYRQRALLALDQQSQLSPVQSTPPSANPIVIFTRDLIKMVNGHAPGLLFGDIKSVDDVEFIRLMDFELNYLANLPNHPVTSAIVIIGQNDLSEDDKIARLLVLEEVPFVLKSLAYYYGSLGEWDRSQDYALRAFQQDPSDDEALYLLSSSYRHLKKFDLLIELAGSTSSRIPLDAAFEIMKDENDYERFNKVDYLMIKNYLKSMPLNAVNLSVWREDGAATAKELNDKLDNWSSWDFEGRAVAAVTLADEGDPIAAENEFGNLLRQGDRSVQSIIEYGKCVLANAEVCKPK